MKKSSLVFPRQAKPETPSRRPARKLLLAAAASLGLGAAAASVFPVAPSAAGAVVAGNTITLTGANSDGSPWSVTHTIPAEAHVVTGTIASGGNDREIWGYDFYADDSLVYAGVNPETTALVRDGDVAGNNFFILGNGYVESTAATGDRIFGALQITNNATVTGTVTLLGDARITAISGVGGGNITNNIGTISGSLVSLEGIGDHTLSIGLAFRADPIPTSGTPPTFWIGAFSRLIFTGDTSRFTGSIEIFPRATLQVGTGSTEGNLSGVQTITLWRDDAPVTGNGGSSGTSGHLLLGDAIAHPALDIFRGAATSTVTLAATLKGDGVLYKRGSANLILTGRLDPAGMTDGHYDDPSLLTGDNSAFTGDIVVREGWLTYKYPNTPANADTGKIDVRNVSSLGASSTGSDPAKWRVLSLFPGATLAYDPARDTGTDYNAYSHTLGLTENEKAANRALTNADGDPEQLRHGLTINVPASGVATFNAPGGSGTAAVTYSIERVVSLVLPEATAMSGTVNGIFYSGVPVTAAGDAYGTGGTADIIGAGGVLRFTRQTTSAPYTVELFGSEPNLGAGIRVEGGNTVLLNKTDTYAVGAGGLTVVADTSGPSTVILAGSGEDQIYDTAPVTLDGGVLNMNGHSEAIGPLSGNGSGRIYYETTDPLLQDALVTLTINSSRLLSDGSYAGVNSEYSGRIDGLLNLVKTGDGVLTLGGNLDYKGGTVVQSGTLKLTDGVDLGDNLKSFEVRANATLEIHREDFFAKWGTEPASIASLADPPLPAYMNVVEYFRQDVFGAGNFTKQGLGQFALASASYTGRTTVALGTLIFGAPLILPSEITGANPQTGYVALTPETALYQVEVRTPAGTEEDPGAVTVTTQTSILNVSDAISGTDAAGVTTTYTPLRGFIRPQTSSLVIESGGQLDLRYAEDATHTLELRVDNSPALTGRNNEDYVSRAGVLLADGGTVSLDEPTIYGDIALSNNHLLAVGDTTSSSRYGLAIDGTLTIRGAGETLVTDGAVAVPGGSLRFAVNAPAVEVDDNDVRLARHGYLLVRNLVVPDAAGALNLDFAFPSGVPGAAEVGGTVSFPVLTWSTSTLDDAATAGSTNTVLQRLTFSYTDTLTGVVTTVAGYESQTLSSEETPRGITSLSLAYSAAQKTVSLAVNGPGNHELVWRNETPQLWRVEETDGDLFWQDNTAGLNSVTGTPIYDGFYNYDSVIFQTNGSSVVANVSGEVKPRQITITGSEGVTQITPSKLNLTIEYTDGTADVGENEPDGVFDYRYSQNYYNGRIAGVAGIRKTDSGILQISGAHTFTGKTIVEKNTLDLDDGGVPGEWIGALDAEGSPVPADWNDPGAEVRIRPLLTNFGQPSALGTGGVALLADTATQAEINAAAATAPSDWLVLASGTRLRIRQSAQDFTTGTPLDTPVASVPSVNIMTNRNFTLGLPGSSGDAAGVQKYYLEIADGRVWFSNKDRAVEFAGSGNREIYLYGAAGQNAGSVGYATFQSGNIEGGILSLTLNDPENGVLTLIKSATLDNNTLFPGTVNGASTGTGAWFLNEANNTFSGGTRLESGFLGIAGDRSLGAEPSEVDADNIYVNTPTSSTGSSSAPVLSNVKFNGITYQDTHVSLHANRGILLGNVSLTLRVSPTLNAIPEDRMGGASIWNGETDTMAFIINGSITPSTSSTAGVTKTGYGVLVLAGANSFNGPLLISQGRVVVDNTEAIPHGTSKASSYVSVATGAELNINGTSVSMNALIGGGTVYDNISAGGGGDEPAAETSSWLTLGEGTRNFYFYGTLSNTNGAKIGVLKTGTGAFYLELEDGSNFDGQLLVEQGRVSLLGNSTNPVGSTSRITVRPSSSGTSTAAGSTFDIRNNDITAPIEIKGDGVSIDVYGMNNAGSRVRERTEKAGALSNLLGAGYLNDFTVLGLLDLEYLVEDGADIYLAENLPRVSDVRLLGSATIGAYANMEIVRVTGLGDLTIRRVDTVPRNNLPDDAFVDTSESFGNGNAPSSLFVFRGAAPVIQLSASQKNSDGTYTDGSGQLIIDGAFVYIHANDQDTAGQNGVKTLDVPGGIRVRQYGNLILRAKDAVAVTNIIPQAKPLQHYASTPLSAEQLATRGAQSTALTLSAGALTLVDGTRQTLHFLSGDSYSHIAHAHTTYHADMSDIAGTENSITGTLYLDIALYDSDPATTTIPDWPEGKENYNIFSGTIGRLTNFGTAFLGVNEEIYDEARDLRDTNTSGVAVTEGYNIINPIDTGAYDANISIVKTGLGEFTLGGAASNYTGATRILAGTLILTAPLTYTATSGVLGDPTPGNDGQASKLYISGGARLKSTYEPSGTVTVNNSVFQRLFTIGDGGAIIESSYSNPGRPVTSGGGLQFTSPAGQNFIIQIDLSSAVQTVTLELTGDRKTTSYTNSNILGFILPNPPDSTGRKRTTLKKTGTGEWILGAKNTYTGDTLLVEGTLRLAITDAIHSASKIVFGASAVDPETGRKPYGILSLGTSTGINQTLSNFEVLDTDPTTAVLNRIVNGGPLVEDPQNYSVLTFNIVRNADRSFSGSIGDPYSASKSLSQFTLAKTGGGTLTLSGRDVHTGNTLVKEGTLRLGGRVTSLLSEYIFVDPGLNAPVSEVNRPVLDVSLLRSNAGGTASPKYFTISGEDYLNRSTLVAGRTLTTGVYDALPDLIGDFQLQGGVLYIGGSQGTEPIIDSYTGEPVGNQIIVVDRAATLTIDGTLSTVASVKNAAGTEVGVPSSTILFTFASTVDPNLNSSTLTYDERQFLARDPATLTSDEIALRETLIARIPQTNDLLVVTNLSIGGELIISPVMPSSDDERAGYRLAKGTGDTPVSYPVIKYNTLYVDGFADAADAAERLAILNSFVEFRWDQSKFTDPRYTILFRDDAAGKMIYMDVYATAYGNELYWVGDPNQQWGDPASTGANFFQEVVNPDGTISRVGKTSYAPGDTAIFDDQVSDPLRRLVTIVPEGVTLGEARFDNSIGRDYTITADSGPMSGSTGYLVKSGTGVLNLLADNEYAGGTIIYDGTIYLGTDLALGLNRRRDTSSDVNVRAGRVDFYGGTLISGTPRYLDYDFNFFSGGTGTFDTSGGDMRITGLLYSTGSGDRGTLIKDGTTHNDPSLGYTDTLFLAANTRLTQEGNYATGDESDDVSRFEGTIRVDSGSVAIGATGDQIARLPALGSAAALDPTQYGAATQIAKMDDEVIVRSASAVSEDGKVWLGPVWDSAFEKLLRAKKNKNAHSENNGLPVVMSVYTDENGETVTNYKTATIGGVIIANFGSANFSLADRTTLKIDLDRNGTVGETVFDRYKAAGTLGGAVRIGSLAGGASGTAAGPNTPVVSSDVPGAIQLVVGKDGVSTTGATAAGVFYGYITDGAAGAKISLVIDDSTANIALKLGSERNAYTGGTIIRNGTLQVGSGLAEGSIGRVKAFGVYADGGGNYRGVTGVQVNAADGSIYSIDTGTDAPKPVIVAGTYENAVNPGVFDAFANPTTFTQYAVGALPNGGYDVVIEQNGTLLFNGDRVEKQIFDYKILSYGTIAKDNTNALVFTTENPEIHGTVQILNGSIRIGDGQNVLNGGNVLGDAEIRFGSDDDNGGEHNRALIFDCGDSTYTIANKISGDGELQKLDPGRLIFTGDNLSTGITNISNGVFQIWDGSEMTRTKTYSASNIVVTNSELRLVPGDAPAGTEPRDHYLDLGANVSGVGASITVNGTSPSSLAIITGDISINGTIVVNSGILQLGNGSDAKGTIAGGAQIQINNGGHFRFSKPYVAGDALGTVVSSKITADSGAFLTVERGLVTLTESNAIAGHIYVGNNTGDTSAANVAKLQIGSGGHSGAINAVEINPVEVFLFRNAELIFNRDGTGVTTGSKVTVKGQGNIVKRGPGEIVFDSVSEHTGGTIVEEGRLIIDTANLPLPLRDPATYDTNGYAYLEATGSGVLELRHGAVPVQAGVTTPAFQIGDSIRGTGIISLAPNETVLAGAYAAYEFVAGGSSSSLNVLEVQSWASLSLGAEADTLIRVKTISLARNSLLSGQGTVAGNLVVAAGASVFSNTTPVGKITVNGDITTAGDVGFKVTYSTPTHYSDSGYISDAVHYTGTVTFEPGATISLDFSELGSADTNLPATGTTFELFIDDNTADGKPSIAGNYTIGNYNELEALGIIGKFFFYKTGNGVAVIFADDLSDVPGFDLPDSLSDFTRYLNTVLKSSNPGAAAARETIYQLLGSDASTAGEAFKSTVPSMHAALPTMSISAAHDAASSLREHLEALRYERGVQNTTINWAPYIVGTGAYAKYENPGANDPAFDIDSYGALVGFDSDLGTHFTLGANVGYNNARARFHSGSNGDKATSENIRGTLYASLRASNWLFFDAQFHGGYSSYETRGHDVFGGKTAKPEGTDIGAGLYVGSVIPLPKFISFTPFAGFDYVSATVSNFSEKGSAAAMHLDEITQDSLQIRIGSGLNWLINPWSGAVLRLGCEVAYTVEMLDTDASITARFANDTSGNSFRITAPALPEHTLQAGPRVELTFGGNKSLNIGYTYETDFGSLTIHRFNASFRIRF
ncbi:MAG: autotransporter-associated beta strand repeat-containing protein [Puniceicoccales bacterium]|jgi:autotransporter-associated beta strand protein|nr:autotransporter-associated beta strand repeat-containing protein [Puniceicoccales bacterium]